MKLDCFIEALRAAGLEPEPETVADFFFLASRMEEAAGLRPPERGAGEFSPDTTAGDTAVSQVGGATPPSDTEKAAAAARNARIERSGVFTTTSEKSERTVPAHEIEVPEAPPLPAALEIARSLRPLAARFAAPGVGVLDEEATAEQTAHQRQLTLVFQPQRERWFDVALVVEDTPSMAVWKKTIDAFERLLVDHGAFRDVRRWRFTSDAALVDTAGRPAGSSALLAPDGRRLLLILTQGASMAWGASEFAAAVVEWAQRQPTAVVQLLPERLWENTRLGEARALARSPRPGLPNAQWEVELPNWMRRRIPNGIALPILTMDAPSLGRWAGMLMARMGAAAPSAYWSTAPAARRSAGEISTRENLSAEDRLDVFRRIATEDGLRLASALAAGPVTLPVLRLVNQTLFGESAKVETMAQILLGGILRKEVDHPDPEQVYYEFHKGVRNLLGRALDSADRFAVRRLVTRYLQKHPDTTSRFRVLVPHKNGKWRLPEWAMPFADEDEELLRASGLLKDRGEIQEPQPQAGSESAGVIAVIGHAATAGAVEAIARVLEEAGYRVIRAETPRPGETLEAAEAVVFAGLSATDVAPALKTSGKPVLVLGGEVLSPEELLERVRRLMVEARELGVLHNLPDLPPVYLERKGLEDRMAALLLQGTGSLVAAGGEEGSGRHTLLNTVVRREDVRRAFRGGIYWQMPMEPPSGLPRLWIGVSSDFIGDRSCLVVRQDGSLTVPRLTYEEAAAYFGMRRERMAVPDYDAIYEIHEGYWPLVERIGNLMEVCDPAVLVHILRDQASTLQSAGRNERARLLLDPARDALEDAPRTFLRLICGSRSPRVPAIVWRFMAAKAAWPHPEKLVDAGFLKEEGDRLVIQRGNVYQVFSRESAGVSEIHALILQAYVQARQAGLPLNDGYFYENFIYHLNHLSASDREALKPALSVLEVDIDALTDAVQSAAEGGGNFVLYQPRDETLVTVLARRLRAEGVRLQVGTTPPDPASWSTMVVMLGGYYPPDQVDPVKRSRPGQRVITVLLPRGRVAAAFEPDVRLTSQEDRAGFERLKSLLLEHSQEAPFHIAYFSYAHNDWSSALGRFFDDVRAAIAAAAGFPVDDPRIAFGDRNMPAGQDVSASMAAHLQFSAVLVCLTTPSYFASEQCGREYAGFERRPRGAEIPRNILPVIWLPTPGGIPAPMNQLQIASTHLLPDYFERGLEFYSGFDPDAYRKFVRSLGNNIVEVWKESGNLQPPRGGTSLESIPNAFGRETEPAARPSHFVLLAGSRPASAGRAVRQTVRWAAEAIAKELARRGFGLVCGVQHGSDQNAIAAFTAELASRYDDLLGALRIVTFSHDLQGAVVPEGVDVLVTEDTARASLKIADVVVLLGGNQWARNVASEAHSAGKPVFPIPGTGDAAAEIFAEQVQTGKAHPDLPWSRSIERRQDAEAVAAALVEHIARTLSPEGAPSPGIPGFEERLRSRFEWGLLADIKPPDLETKMAILDKKAAGEGIKLPDDVRAFIASKAKPTVRELEGALAKLLAHSSVTGKPIDLQMASQVLKDQDGEWIRTASQSARQKVADQKASDAIEILRERQDLWESDALKPLLREVLNARMHEYARQYEEIRKMERAGDSRTVRLDRLVSEAEGVSKSLPVDRALAGALFDENRPGTRVIAMAVASARPYPEHIDIATSAIRKALSPFEQYHALLLARVLMDRAGAEQCLALQSALLKQEGTPIRQSDPSRARIKAELLEKLDARLQASPRATGRIDYAMAAIPALASVSYSDNPNARHGEFVTTRGRHDLMLPGAFRIGQGPVTNELFFRFVTEASYDDDQFWRQDWRRDFFTQDGRTRGPASWRSSAGYPAGRANHPVTGISYLEASAFVQWLQLRYPEPGSRWCLPTEDMWELSARSEKGYPYPWGQEFSPGLCNSSESHIGATSAVGQFPRGNSLYGCRDMAGNVWEFVEPAEGSYWTCVLRGGSYLNNQWEVMSYFRLGQVAVDHRAPDFGFRCAQIREAGNVRESAQGKRSPKKTSGRALPAE